jgi:hypothetical protein
MSGFIMEKDIKDIMNGLHKVIVDMHYARLTTSFVEGMKGMHHVFNGPQPIRGSEIL